MTHELGSLGQVSEPTARNFVISVFRKAKPTSTQAKVARLMNVEVPEGHTHVLGHFRSGSVTAAAYRSRSVRQLLLRTSGSLAPDTKLETNWFQFELLVRALQKRQSFVILRTATQGIADDGIEIRVV